METVLRTKCVLLGDPTTGKSTFLSTCSTGQDDTSKNYEMVLFKTLIPKTVESPVQVVQVYNKSTNFEHELHIQDTSGTFINSIHHLYYVLFFDMTNESSFHSCQQLVKTVTQHSPTSFCFYFLESFKKAL
ncbi:intraflagellar transport protein 27 homolog [Octopus sinensis]|uniref:Intraflagellar transport protein 27 homolog n=1 Tax=Octopus sinensis TaxID=2607531 RepID=A0A6P7U0B4_9MOLL|nr:intraflagellar transport protein 27 homolog [Octopus sinensis]